MTATVLCIVPSEERASDVVLRLGGAAFPRRDISVLIPKHSGAEAGARRSSDRVGDGAVSGAGAGAIAGGALGLLAGVGALAIPGIGPVVAAGPIVAAFSGMAVGVAAGGVAGTLLGMGVAQVEARRYEGEVRSGNILVSVRAATAERAQTARAIFENAGATDITMSRETPAAATKPAASRRKASRSSDA